MNAVILYMAISLDGYIARKNGDVSWLYSDQDYGYNQFYQSIGTLIMGRTTYDYIKTFGDYPYPGVKSYILTHHPELVTPPHNGECYTGDIEKLITDIRGNSQKNIWVVGGANVAQACLQNNVIDEIRLFIHPIILGDGIRLFSPTNKEIPLTLVDAKEYSTGLTSITYRIKKT